MKKRTGLRALAWSVVLVAALVAMPGCGVDPEGVAEEFVTRFAERSFENLDRYVAADQRAEFREVLAEYQAGLADPTNPGQRTLSTMILSIEDVETEIVSRDEATARVRLILEVEAKGPAKDAPFLDTPGHAIRITEAEIKGSLDILLVKEKGRWLVDLMNSFELWDDATGDW